MRGLPRLGIGLALFGVVAAAACGAPSAGAADLSGLCQARTALLAAGDDAQRAINAAIAGDQPQAKSKADAAAIRATEAQNAIKLLPKDLQAGEAAKGLLEVRTNVGRAINAVRGGPNSDAYAPEKARSELVAARAAMAKIAVACPS
jgi:hypothetical protein